jgi:hypothetical protein
LFVWGSPHRHASTNASNIDLFSVKLHELSIKKA